MNKILFALFLMLSLTVGAIAASYRYYPSKSITVDKYTVATAGTRVQPNGFFISFYYETAVKHKLDKNKFKFTVDGWTIEELDVDFDQSVYDKTVINVITVNLDKYEKKRLAASKSIEVVINGRLITLEKATIKRLFD